MIAGLRAPQNRTEGLGARLTFAAAALAAVCGLAACGDDDGGSDAGPDMTRVAWARVFQHGQTTLPNQSPASVGRALAGLEPTWVTGLIRLEEGESPTKSEIAGYKEVRDLVTAKAPDAEFDIELNALEYKTAEEVQDQMSSLRETFDNDGWFFDFFTPAYKLRPEVVDAAIKEAHDNGQWVGGNTFGWDEDPANPVVPDDADYLAVADDNFKLNLDAVNTLDNTLPILFHLRNNPDNPKSEGCIYIKNYSNSKREAYVSERARQQQQYGFSFAYPVFFPTCLPSPTSNPNDIVAFDSIKDADMLRTIEGLMQKYN